MTANEIARRTIDTLADGPEWDDIGMVNLHEVAEFLEGILVPLADVFAPLPDGWNPYARTYVRIVMEDVIKEMDRSTPSEI